MSATTTIDRRKPGRPRVEEPHSSVSTWIWSRHHDRLIHMAHQQDVSVSTLVRNILSNVITRPGDK